MTRPAQNEKQITKGALSCEDFSLALERERARADRSEQFFSVLVLQGNVLNSTEATDHLIRRIGTGIRMIDEIGWFDERRIGLLLPFTTSSGARTVMDRIRRMVKPSSLIFKIYSYPGQWLSEEQPKSGTGFGAGSDRSNQTSDAGRSESPFEYRTPLLKRVMDIVISAVAILILSPIFLAVATVIGLVSPGPIFLRQKRIGLHGRVFHTWKFRAMEVGTDTELNPRDFRRLMTSDRPMKAFYSSAGPLTIPFGNIIRQCYLDELPQLFNVLRGDMSLVGPRPYIASSQYRLWQRMRCDVAPGMTGLWQVSGKNKTTFKEMLRLDIAYVRHWSLGLDVRILLRTLPALLSDLLDDGCYS
jgi:lipopolysaccharide/colanic/teichoic acid biosynthesis glycosyltransferase